MDNEKILDIVTKMYSEMQEGFKNIYSDMQEGFKNTYSDMQEGFKNIYSDMQEGFKRSDGQFAELKHEIAKINMTIEHDISPKLKALLDGYKQLSEGQEAIKEDIRNLSLQQQNQEFEIKVLKGKAK